MDLLGYQWSKMKMKTCSKENTVKIGRVMTLHFWSDGSITIGTAGDSCALRITPGQIENAYNELVRRGLLAKPSTLEDEA
jgi:hypothetical protein